MKKIFSFLFLYFLFPANIFSQFSATLTGNPLITTGWSIGGFATAVDSFVELTTPAANENGYVYYNTPESLTACGQFTVKFDYQIIVPIGGGGTADGIAFFYISTPPAGFISGGGLGLPSPLTGMVFTLDTWDNDGDLLNPESQLFGYTTPSTYTEANRTQMITGILGHETLMDDGTWHHCEIDYNAGNINVYLDYATSPSMTGFYLITIPSGYFGFSASTGAAFSTQNVKSVYITASGTAVPPGVTSPVTYCQNATATALSATGTGPFHWYTSDTATVVSLPGSPTPGTHTTGATTYYVRQGAGACISAPDSIKVIVNPNPAAPVVSGTKVYCRDTSFIPFVVTGATGAVLWYNTGVGGVGSTVAPVVNTTLPGRTTWWASQTLLGCESPRDSITVTVHPTPAIPSVTGATEYCQYFPYVAPVATALGGASGILWYTAPSGGTGSSATPTVNTSDSGAYIFYITESDSGCISPRGTFTVIVHPKPAPPAITGQGPYCQFQTTAALIATPSKAGDYLTWFGAGIADTGTLLTPTPQMDTAETDSFYVNETSIYGCISNKALDTVRIIARPQPPVARDSTYCQTFPSVPLNYQVDSARSSYLNWYAGGASVPLPFPSTVLPGTVTWYVGQTVHTCKSDSVAVKVTTLYLPKFSITAASPYVCDADSITLYYTGQPLVNGGYLWTLPPGDSFAAGANNADSMIMVKFDSAARYTYIYLKGSDYNGRCATIDTISIKVVPAPSATSYTKADVCLGDTTTLAIAGKTDNAANFTWYVDYFTLLGSSQALNIISANSNSGGPFMISWLDTGRHVIQLNSTTEEGCTSAPTFDTVFVHTPPDASFSFKYTSTSLCLEDSVYFTANTEDYNNSFTWSPAHSFSNINKPEAWGQLEQTQSIITLTVTDPFGCTASTSHELDPGTCCTVAFPNAFTPNGDGHNDKFRPLFTGYHNFHVFRIVNRWGQTVYESTNSNMQWDGTLNGVPQDMGVYFYYIKYDCGGQTIEESGDVTLIR
jgi:gliding motility-associated-like protein